MIYFAIFWLVGIIVAYGVLLSYKNLGKFFSALASIGSWFIVFFACIEKYYENRRNSK